MPKRNNIRVRFEKGWDSWVIRVNKQVWDFRKTKDHAVSRARNIAKVNTPAELTVYNKRDGKVCIKDTYEGDPVGIKG